MRREAFNGKGFCNKIFSLVQQAEIPPQEL